MTERNPFRPAAISGHWRRVARTPWPLENVALAWGAQPASVGPMMLPDCSVTSFLLREMTQCRGWASYRTT